MGDEGRLLCYAGCTLALGAGSILSGRHGAATSKGQRAEGKWANGQRSGLSAIRRQGKQTQRGAET